ncbi:MAG: hypothetical protein KF850_03430 [Labilithrix sp.]|nr:hypothetical protein [Labilithrix sp.]
MPRAVSGRARATLEAGSKRDPYLIDVPGRRFAGHSEQRAIPAWPAAAELPPGRPPPALSPSKP